MASREPRVRECTERAKTHLADDFIMHAASEEFLWEVVVEGAPPGTTKRAVVYNTFNDVVGQTTGMLKKCYARILGDAEAAEMLAVRDMLEFDSVSPDGSTYTVGGKEYFMPYVPGYVTSGPGELALFSLTADDAGADGAVQVRLVVEKLQLVLSELGLTFEDVVVLWNRCAKLDEIEEAVLMTRSRDFGLTRPLAEAVLEVVDSDPNPAGAALEYIVVAKLPRALAEVRALA